MVDGWFLKLTRGEAGFGYDELLSARQRFNMRESVCPRIHDGRS